MPTLHIEIQYKPTQYILNYPKNKSLKECIEDIAKKYMGMGEDIFVYDVVKRNATKTDIVPMGRIIVLHGKWYWFSEKKTYANLFKV